MPRIRSFALPHKGLRNALSQFSLEAGRTSYHDPEQLNELKTLGHALFTMLNEHMHTENEHTLKSLEERAPGSSAHDLSDHEELEPQQNSLEQMLIGFTGKEDPDTIHEFYLEFTKFHSRYLEHILYEEQVTEKLIQANFTDEELIEHRQEVMKRMDFHVLLLFLKYVIPAQSMEENVAVLSGFKANAPAQAFEAVCAAIKPGMLPLHYDRLLSYLN